MEDKDSNDSSQCHSWSKKEIDMLIEIDNENKNLLEGTQGPLVTEANKPKKWQDILAVINACGVGLRTADTYSLRRCQDRIDTCRRLPDSLRRCKTPSQTGGAPAGDTQTVCNGTKTVWVPALDFHTICDGARQSLRQKGFLQDPPRSGILSGTVCESPAGAQSGTILESPASTNTVLASSPTV
ncbi:hypothetical protein DPMN_063668 [Dreissena polymorpha]|uniref:Myb/SANT-like DNA-binding domain-containing protein n=1 Tax=Dreissena polymorpha TaxID=45954 RepID=A0A9D4CC63_DREPO|nr:hypothetical protein DPMN_063668 [Dreissena polymorpha]